MQSSGEMANLCLPPSMSCVSKMRYIENRPAPSDAYLEQKRNINKIKKQKLEIQYKSQLHNVHDLGSNEDAHNAEDEQNDGEHEQVDPEAGEVVLGLKSEGGESDYDDRCDSDSDNHRVGLVDRRDAADDERLHDCEDHQQDHVERELTRNAFAACQYQHNHKCTFSV